MSPDMVCLRLVPEASGPGPLPVWVCVCVFLCFFVCFFEGWQICDVMAGTLGKETPLQQETKLCVRNSSQEPVQRRDMFTS